MRNKRKLFLTLLLFFVVYPDLFAKKTGNTGHQEIADVVFRNLDFKLGPITNVHSAIYVGHTNKKGLASEPSNHEVIEMSGIQPGGISGFKVTNVKGIDFDNFRSFQTAHPQYYGAFMHSSNPDIETRKAILDKAQELMTRPTAIDYIVKKNEPILRLLTNYFEYEENGGKIELGDISRMRCDAFVEYCYAAAGVPIMPYDITTETGANALITWASRINPITRLYPSDQLNSTNLVASSIDNPTVAISEFETGQSVVNLTGKTDLKFSMTDLKSGPGLLEIQRAQDEYFVGDTIKISFELKSGNNINVNNIGFNKEKILTKSDGIARGTSYTGYVYDQAGNSSEMFSFTISDYPIVSIYSTNPLYENFKGTTSANPSSIEKTHTILFEDLIAGVSSATIMHEGSNLIEWSFDPPVDSTAAYLTGMSPGQYVVKAINSTGLETIAPFKIVEIGVFVSTRETTANIEGLTQLAPSSFTANVSMSVFARADEGLGKIQILDTDDNVIGEKILDGVLKTTVTIDFTYSKNYDVSQPTEPLHQMIKIKAVDMAGNYKENIQRLLVSANKFYDENTGNFENPPLTSFKTPVIDVTEPFYLTPNVLTTMFVGGKIETEVYAAEESPTGAGIDTRPISEYIATETKISGFLGATQAIGNVKVIIRTSDSSDMSGAEAYVISNGNLYFSIEGCPTLPDGGGILAPSGYPTYGDVSKCYADATPPQKITVKRFVQAEAILTKTRPSTIVQPLCSRFSESDPNYCEEGGDAVPTISSLGPALIGISIVNIEEVNIGKDKVSSGENILVDISGNISVIFDKVDVPGNLFMTITYARPPDGYKTIPENTVFNIEPDSNLNFTGNAHITFRYDPSGITPEQESRMKLVKVIDPATGKYEDLNGILDTTNKTISADIASFSKFMVLVPEYLNPKESQSVNLVSGLPEMEFISNQTITQEQYDITTAEGQFLVKSLKSRDQIFASNVYKLGPDGLEFSPGGVIKMRYSDAVLSGLGVEESGLGIYQFTADGSIIAKLPYNTINTDKNEITARVPKFTSLFAILASSQQAENIPPSIYPDGISPETTMGFEGISFPASDGTFISDKSSITFTAVDPEIPNVETSGVTLTNYVINPGTSTIEISTYTYPFSLNEGVSRIYYFSLDNAGNYEFPRSATIYVDALAPETSIEAENAYISGEILYVSTGSPVSLRAYDPPGVDNVQSGIKWTYFLIDITSEQCASTPTFSGAEGTCDNPLYTRSFTLSESSHSITFFSSDNVDNTEDAKEKSVYADGTAPVTTLSVDGEAVADGAKAYINEADSVTLTAVDPVSNGVASGVKFTGFLVDRTLEECGEIGEPDPSYAPGTCENPLYGGPFALEPGTHTVYYMSVDNVGNEESVKSAEVEVGDFEPPETTINFEEPKYITDVSTYITGRTTFTLTAVDMPLIGFSGVKLTEYKIDGGSWTTYEGGLTLARIFGVPELPPAIPEGRVGYWSFNEGSGSMAYDGSGNGNDAALVNGPVWTEGRRGSALLFDGVDDMVVVPYSPKLSLDKFTVEAWIKRHGDKEANILVKRYQPDWKDNYGLHARADGTIAASAYSPDIWTWFGVTSVNKIVSGQWYHIAGTYDRQTFKIYINGELDNEKAFTYRPYQNNYPMVIGRGCTGDPCIFRPSSPSFDGIIDEVAIYGRALSGEEIRLQYIGIPTVSEGDHIISYRSVDNAGNTEDTKEQAVTVDESPPETEFSLSGNYVLADPVANGAAAGIWNYQLSAMTSSYAVEDSTAMLHIPPGYKLVYSTNPGHYILESGSQKPAGKWVNFITSGTEIVLKASDTYSGVKFTEHAACGGDFTRYDSPFTLLGEDGLCTLKYRSVDNLGHVEITRSSEVYLDNTPPESRLIAEGFNYQSDGVIYVSRRTLLTIIAKDGGCGVKEIEYSIDAGPYIAYTGPFGIGGLAEGEHTISYRSEDLLGNKEATRTQAVVLDASPPETGLEVGTPKLEEAGKIYITSMSEISLLPHDELSGVGKTLWRIDAGGWLGYKGPFRFADVSAAAMPEGCVAHWDFEEGGGSVARDASGNNNNGTIHGASRVQGRFGEALSFDGWDDKVVASAANFPLGDASRTITAWVKPYDDRFCWGCIAHYGQGDCTGLMFGIGRHYGRLAFWGGCNDYGSPFTLPNGEWTFIAIVYTSPGRLTFYANERSSEQEMSRGLSTRASNFFIGAETTDNGERYRYHFAGAVDEVMIHNRALSAEEIKRIYEGEQAVEVADGEHLFSYYSVDNVGNAEGAKSWTFVIDSSGPAKITDFAAVERTTCSVTVRWSVPEDAGALGRVGKYAISYSSVSGNLALQEARIILSAAAGETAGSGKEYEINDLQEGTSYYAAIWSYDPLGNVSEISNIVSTRTHGYAQSEDGTASLTIVSDEDLPEITVTAVSSESAQGEPYYAAMTEQGLVSLTPYYEFEPGGVQFSEPAKLSFIFDPTGIDTTTVGIYYFDGKTWTTGPVFNQWITLLEDGTASIEGYINHTSLYGVFYYTDIKPPRTEIRVEGVGYRVEGMEYVTAKTSFTLTSIDDLIEANDGIGLGVKEQTIVISEGGEKIREKIFKNEEPKQGEEFVSTFTFLSIYDFSDGLYDLNYKAEDIIGNEELPKTLKIAVDNTAPISAWSGIGDWIELNSKFYLNAKGTIELQSIDPVVNGVASGLKGIYYGIDSSPANKYTSPFGLNEGIRTVNFKAEDNVGNAEITKSTTVYVDGTAPVTSFSISPPLYIAGGVRYITPESELTFTANDPVIREVASGVNRTEVSLDGGEYFLYAKALKFAEGVHTIKYRSTDNVENAEPSKTLMLYSDATPPVTSLSVKGTNNNVNGTNYVNADTEFVLTARDPVIKGTASGIKTTGYSVEGIGESGVELVYTLPFKLQKPDGLKQIKYYSTDNVGNKETEQTAEFELDTTPPEAGFICPGETGGFCAVFKGTISVLGTARDKNFKEYRLQYAEGAEGGAEFKDITVSTEPPSGIKLAEWLPPREGYYTLKLKVLDFADNETERQKTIYAGDAGLLMAVGDKKMFKNPRGIAISGNGDIYIADTGNDRIAVYTSTGGYKAEYGGKAEKEKGNKKEEKERLEFKQPRGVALDEEGNIYVADTLNDRIVKLSPEGEELMSIGCRKEGKDNKEHGEKFENHKSTGCFHQPYDVAISSTNEIYVADTKNSRVQKFSMGGEFLLAFRLPQTDKKEIEEEDDNDENEEEKKGEEEKDALGRPLLTACRGRPYGIALNNEGDIYITDGKGRRVLKYNSEGILENEIGEDINWKKPYGIYIDGKSQCLIVTDEKERKIYKFNKKEELNFEYGGEKEDKEEELKKPSGIALGNDGNLYMAEAGNDKILKYGMPAGETIIIVSAKEEKEKDEEDKKHRVSGTNRTSSAGPNPEFKLGEVYVFPNPAIGRQKPTFHIEVGIADRVKIRVYTVSGRFAHEHTIRGMPQVVDDGSGAQYAYEYTWDEEIPSGIYYYHIRAEKSGRKLEKTGKFAIIR
mgnify:CR=1 FL=1